MRRSSVLAPFALAIALASPALAGRAYAQEPGLDAAAPRFTISQVDNRIGFTPPGLVVERGDWVRWKSIATTLSHTTTRGSGCIGDDPQWDFTLLPGTQFSRQFTEDPGVLSVTIPYFCVPHCAVGMKGTVTVTIPIKVAASRDSLDQLILTWSGGGGLYRVIRSDSSTFCAISPAYPACTTTTKETFLPDLGESDTTFTDSTQAGPGKVLYYLVLNKVLNQP